MQSPNYNEEGLSLVGEFLRTIGKAAWLCQTNVALRVRRVIAHADESQIQGIAT